MKKLICILLALLAMTGISACSHSSPPAAEQTSPVTLNDRQKQILREEGLSEDYEALTASQQASITAIEQMLAYADEKYGTEFSYAGYIPNGPMEKEHLLAYPASGFMSIDTFTITKTADGYEDDYPTVACRDPLAEYITKAISDIFPDAAVQVFPEIISTSLAAIPENPSDFDGRINARLTIFVDSSTCSEDDISLLQRKIQVFLYEHQLDCSGRIIPLEPDKFPNLDKFNYTDHLSETYYSFNAPE